jgi:hypothetical protein
MNTENELRKENEALRTQNASLRKIMAQNGLRVNMEAIPRTVKTKAPLKEGEEKKFSEMSGDEKTKLYKQDPAKYEDMKNSALYFNG